MKKKISLACISALAMSMVLHGQCVVTDNLRIAAGTMAPPFASCGDALTYQGYGYVTVQIGDQCWFAENLRSEHYQNGDAIPSNLSALDWSSTTSGAVAVYGEGGACTDSLSALDCDPTQFLSEYGRLYNWYAVDDARGLCPSGWHVPTDVEWTMLTDYFGGESVAGTQMKADYGWYDGGSGTNTSGFSGLPGGFRGYQGWFASAQTRGHWWSSSPQWVSNAFFREMFNIYDSVYSGPHDRRMGKSVRCVQDAE